MPVVDIAATSGLTALLLPSLLVGDASFTFAFAFAVFCEGVAEREEEVEGEEEIFRSTAKTFAIPSPQTLMSSTVTRWMDVLARRGLAPMPKMTTSAIADEPKVRVWRMAS